VRPVTPREAFMRRKCSVCSERPTNTPRCWSTSGSKSLSSFFRRYLIMEDQYKQLDEEYKDRQEKIKQMIPSEEDFHMQAVTRMHYMHMLANEKVRLNDTIGR